MQSVQCSTQLGNVGYITMITIGGISVTSDVSICVSFVSLMLWDVGIVNVDDKFTAKNGALKKPTVSPVEYRKMID